MVAPAIKVFADAPHLGLVGVRFPVELRADGVVRSDPTSWPTIDGRLEYVGGRLLYMPPCADIQQDVAMDVAYILRSWSEECPGFIVGGNEAGMKLGDDVRAADVAVWRASDAGERRGRLRTAPPLLAVEIAGEDEEERVLKEKALWYLQHGVAMVWLVLPETREVVVVNTDGTQRFGTGARLPATALLPGLQPDVARFFAQLDR